MSNNFPPNNDDMPDWLLDDDQDDQTEPNNGDWLQAAEDNASGDLPDINWETPANQSGTGDSGISLKGLTGTLPWNAQASDEPGATTGNNIPAVDWGTPANQGGTGDSGVSLKGLTGTLPWNAQASEGAPPSSDEMVNFLDTTEQPALRLPPERPAPPPGQVDFNTLEARDDDPYTFDDVPLHTGMLRPRTPVQSNDPLDWLSGDDAPAAPPPPITGGFQQAADDDAMPDWLSDTPAEPASDDFGTQASDTPDWFSTPAEASAGDFGYADETSSDDTPEWLTGVSSPATSTDDFGFGAEATGSDDMPEWLTGVSAPAEASAGDFGFAEETSDDAMPEWLTGVSAPAETSNDDFGFGTETAGSDETPEWLTGVSTPAEASAGDFGFAEETSSDDMPEWLTGAAAPAENSADDFGFGDAAADGPDWLTEDDAVEQATPASGLPDWLSGTAAPVESAEAGAFDLGGAESGGDDLDDWMNTPAAPAAPAAATPPARAASNYNDQDFDSLFGDEQAEPLEPAPWGAPAEDISYSEWERREEEKANAVNQPPSELDEVPDWFLDVDAGTAAPAGTASAGEYMPEWFMGVEELNEDTAPDWLKSKSPTPPAAPPPPDMSAIMGGDLELPDFDDILGTPAPEIASSGAMSLDDLFGEEPELDMPGTGDLNWLADDEAAPALDMPGTGDLNWMNDAPAEAVADATPDWLRDYTPEQATPAAPAFELPPDPADEGALNWLEGVDFAAPTPPPATPVRVTTPAAASLPPAQPLDLDDFDLDALLGSDTEIALPSANLPATIGGNDLDSLTFEDDMFRDFAPAPSAEPTLQPGDFVLPDEDEIELAEGEALPEWMSRAAASTDTVNLKVGAVQAQLEQVPLVVLPPDLRVLREHMHAHLARAFQGQPAATAGPLAGIDGALPRNPELAKPGVTAISQGYGLTETQQARLGSLQRILEIVQAETARESIKISYSLDDDEEEIVETAPKAAPRKRVKRQLDRMLMSVALLLLFILPFVTDALHLAPEPPTTLDAEAQPIAAAVDQLAASGQANNPPRVLVAFEYAPTAAQELDPLVEAVLRDILANGGQPVALSTNPIGMLHARQVLENLAEDEALLTALSREEPLQAAADYVVLPLLAGGPIGVRSLANGGAFATLYFTRDVSGQDTRLEVEEMAETFAFVIVVGERPEDTQIWAEQFAATRLPMFALVTSSAEPLTRAYYSAGVYDGLLSGIQGTLMYNTARNSTTREAYSGDFPDPDISRWHSAVLGTSLAAGLIGLGMVINLIRALRRRRT